MASVTGSISSFFLWETSHSSFQSRQWWAGKINLVCGSTWPKLLVYSLQAIVTFALSLVDALLFVHYTAVLLLEIRQMPPRYYVHVIRSPDGISKGYAIGAVRTREMFAKVPSVSWTLSPLPKLSIQRAAVWLLDKYYADFPIYNPYLERLPPRRTRSKLHHSSSFKFYDLDAQQNNGSVIQVRNQT